MNTSLSLGGLLAGTCLLGVLAYSAPSASSTTSHDPKDAELMQLREDFHLASTLGDYGLMLSLWAEDAVFNSPAGTVVGASNIADFFESGPFWGTTVSLTSESKASFVRHGNEAYFEFECIIVDVGGGDPLSTSLSTLPPGNQNPNVEILQHSNTHGMAVHQGGRWVFKTFNGSGGPL